MTGDPEGRAVHEELRAAETAVAEQARLSRRVDSLAGQLREAEQQVADLQQRQAVQSAELRKLETLSPTRIWAALRGSHASDLEREQAEQQASEYAVAHAAAHADQVRAELEAVRWERDALGDTGARRERALAATEEWIRGSGGPRAAELGEIAAATGSRRSALVETEEALEAAHDALHALGRALQELESAGSWSTFDTFLGGGLITDMVKYERIDAAEQLMRAADAALRRLSRELADVGLDGVAGVQVTELTRLFDVWFDNIFSDWSVRNRISEAAARLDATLRKVSEVRHALVTRAGQLGEELAQLDRRRVELLGQG